MLIEIVIQFLDVCAERTQMIVDVMSLNAPCMFQWIKLDEVKKLAEMFQRFP